MALVKRSSPICCGTRAIFAVLQIARHAHRNVLGKQKRPQLGRHARQARQNRDGFSPAQNRENVLFAGEVYDFSAHGHFAQVVIQAQSRRRARRKCVAHAHAHAALRARITIDNRRARLDERNCLGRARKLAARAIRAVRTRAMFRNRENFHRCENPPLSSHNNAERPRQAHCRRGRNIRMRRQASRRCERARLRDSAARCSRTTEGSPCCRTRQRAAAGT